MSASKMKMNADEITALSATALSSAIHRREVSCEEVMRAYLDRIAVFQPKHNAFVNLLPSDQAIALAREADQELAKGQSRGWMHGMPQAVKDLAPLKGFPLTMGSPLLAQSQAAQDGLMTARMRAAGAIFIGKTNVPEFGLGSHSFNEVFGVTVNAYNMEFSAGGSSGGAAVALALNLLPVADGSDFMGSLRNPAGWNNVVGMRPSQGRVPMWPANDYWLAQLGTEGPMGRTVEDVARLLAVQSGGDQRVPLSRQDRFDLDAALAPWQGSGPKIGWLGDLNAYLATDHGVTATCEQRLRSWSSQGAEIEAIKFHEQLMDPAELWQCWLTWRKVLVGPRIAPLLKMRATPQQARALIKPEALWEYDQSLVATASDFTRASAVRSQFYSRFNELMQGFDVIALPSAQVWPFPIGQRWPKEIAGRTMDTYHRWMEATIYATLLGAPAVCIPAGFNRLEGAQKGLPMGIQLIGKPGGDAEVLRVAQHLNLFN